MVKHQETCQYGSFKAWGACFFYTYDAPNLELNIHLQEADAPLITYAVGKRLHKKILTLVNYLDKAAQIKALMLSNGETIHIGETMEPRRLKGLTSALFDSALYALDLEAGKSRRFTTYMAQTFDLKHFSIKRFTCQTSDSVYYRASLRTHSDNELVGRSLTLNGILMTVSEKIVGDLIALEFNARDNSAQNLLSLSSKLSTIGRILNEGFYPSQKIKRPETADIQGANAPL
ncbi:MAG TPA: hypothetical protein PLO23_00435 [Alphaproteobacteria bacterium]|nr:hypothetical protein [Alphaproteobacteria bacterium]